MEILEGNLRTFRPVDLPPIPGYDVAGTVEAVGQGVTSFKVVDAVFGRGSRTYAEYCAIPANTVAFKPRNLNFDEAASVNVGSVTSWLASGGQAKAG